MSLLSGPLLLAAGLALFALVLVALGSGRPEGRVRVPTHLAASADTLRRRAHTRIAIATAAVLIAFSVTVVATIEVLHGLPAWAAAFLVSAGAGSALVAWMGPAREAPAPIRTAELSIRTARGFGPGWAFTVPAILAALLVAALVACMVVAGESEGRDVLTWSTTYASGSVGPYPGWRTGLPLLVALLVAGALFAVALHRIAGWPRPVEADLADLDDDIRRATTRMLLLGTTGALLGALGTFGVAVAATWGNLLSNQREALAQVTGQALTDPTRTELVWRVVHVGGLLAWLGAVVLMVSAAALGRVRRPQLGDPTEPVEDARAAQ
ncbi:MAG: hypothetical protein WCF36_12405 [Candidatus Nanopelagicales bacterium]